MFDKIDVSIIIGTVCGICSAFLGPLDGVILTLLCFMGLDYITGVVSGAIAGELSSKTGFKGLLKKVLILLIIGAIHTAELRFLGSDGHALRDGVCAFYIGNEGISILENVHECGVTYPRRIEKLFEAWRTENDETDS